MKIVTQLKHWRAIRQSLQGKTIGFVATMGNLHAGHLSLCTQAKQENDITIVSIFVNPMQFNETQDFDHYPRTIDQDIQLLKAHHIDYLLLPSVEELYHDQYQIRIVETLLSSELEGIFRPEHFTGVLTIVLKLLNLIQPTHAYFGEKDYQQFLLIKKMVHALFLNTEIVNCQTIRDENGIALSSRNLRLTKNQQQKLSFFPRLLQSHLTTSEISQQLEAAGFRVEYIEERWQRRLGAVWLNEVRFIDNVVIGGS